MNEKDFSDYLLSFPNVWIDTSLEENLSVYKIGEQGSEDSKIFALIFNKTKPLKIGLKCDPLLAKSLREDYETVLPSDKLSKKYWNTIICSGQLDEDYIKGLTVLSHNLVAGE